MSAAAAQAVPGWQPDQLDVDGFLPAYLRFNTAPPVPAALLADRS